MCDFEYHINPFMRNVFTHPYKLDLIINLRVVGWYF